MRYLVVFILLLSSSTVFCQAVIKGNVQDATTKQVLDNATVRLYKVPDSTLVSQRLNRRTGFQFNVKPGNYLLISSYTNYKTDTTQIHVDSVRGVFIQLTPVSAVLTEVVIRSSVPPVITKNDTLVYNAGSYKVRPNATVEDLLKKLPGVNVDKEGNVTIQGQKVEKIFIDGKEFYVNDPRLATQNLLANMVDKLEVFDDVSDYMRSKGISDKDPAKGINIKLKPNQRNKLLGRAYGAYGNDERYAAGTTANLFSTKGIISANFNINNTSNLFSPFALKNTGELAPGNNESTNGNVTFSKVFSKRLKIGGNFNYTKIDFQSRQVTSRQTFLQDSSLVSERLQNNNNQNESGGGNFNVSYNPDSLTAIQLSASLNSSKTNSHSYSSFTTSILKTNQNLLNSGVSTNSDTQNRWNENFAITINRRFRKRGRFLQLNVGQGNNDMKAEGSLYSNLISKIDTITRDQRTSQHNKAHNLNVGVVYVEPLGKGQYLDLGWTYQDSRGNADRFAYDYDTVTNLYDDLDSSSSAKFTNENVTNLFSAGYNLQRGKLQYQVGSGVQHTRQGNEDAFANYPKISQAITNYFPRAGLIYSMSRTKNLRLNYRGGTQQPSLQQLQPVTDFSNPLILQIGNPDLKPSFSNSFDAGLIKFDTKRSKQLLLQAGFSFVKNKIVGRTTITSNGVQEQQYINVNGNYKINAGVVYGWKQLKTDTRINYSKDQSFVGAKVNDRKTLNVTENVSGSVNINSHCNVEFASNINFGNTRYSLQAASNAFVNQNHLVDVTYELPAGILLNTNLNWRITGRQGNLEGQSAKFWNAAASKKVFRSKKGEVKLAVYDILKQSRGFRQTIADNYVETNEVHTLQRFGLLSFVWQL